MSNVHFVLDEMAAIGHLESIEGAIGIGRGYGIRLQMYFQSLGQLRKSFPNGQEQTALSNSTQVLFGVNDNATADWVSARLGEETIILESGGSSDGRSAQHSQGRDSTTSGGNSRNTNRNWQQQARKLLKPEEVMALPPRVAITFTPGVPPICTTLLRYYEENSFGPRAGWFRSGFAAFVCFLMSGILCGFSLWLAMQMPRALNRDEESPAARLERPSIQNPGR